MKSEKIDLRTTGSIWIVNDWILVVFIILSAFPNYNICSILTNRKLILKKNSLHKIEENSIQDCFYSGFRFWVCNFSMMVLLIIITYVELFLRIVVLIQNYKHTETFRVSAFLCLKSGWKFSRTIYKERLKCRIYFDHDI